jgi:hypothetical protein
MRDEYTSNIGGGPIRSSGLAEADGTGAGGAAIEVVAWEKWECIAAYKNGCGTRCIFRMLYTMRYTTLAEIAPAFEQEERAIVNPEKLVATDDERAHAPISRPHLMTFPSVLNLPSGPRPGPWVVDERSLPACGCDCGLACEPSFRPLSTLSDHRPMSARQKEIRTKGTETSITSVDSVPTLRRWVHRAIFRL